MRRAGCGAPEQPIRRPSTRGAALAAEQLPDGGVLELFPRTCAWCEGPISPRTRADALTCSKRCRQASWRFKVDRCEAAGGGVPMRFAYADPPYPGCAGYYPERQEVDTTKLVAGLVDRYPDGWALSTSSEAAREVWALCPPGTRLHVWVKRTRRVRAVGALRVWEALLVHGGRPLSTAAAQQLEDVLIYRGRYRAFPGALVGMKPPQFSVWMFRLLGAQPGDRLDDLFPGSGAVGRAWERYTEPSSGAAAQRDASVLRVA